MGRPYSLELRELAQTYEWAANCSVTDLVKAIQDLVDHPFFSIGSGGSLTAAAFWAMVQENWTGMPSKYGTPLDLRALSSPSEYAIGLVSARGSNPDIVNAFEHASLGDARGLVAITLSERSKLHARSAKYPWARLIDFSPPIARDGFLATNSLLSTMILICRAYAEAFDSDLILPSALPEPRLTGTVTESPPTTYSILYAGWAAVAALDLESKLVEGGLATVHCADLRNFAHGRHHWLARHGETTTVVALVTPEWSGLFDRTLAALPEGTRVIRLDSSNDGPFGAIELVHGGFRLIEQIASQQAFDPGQPTVPEFGRHLYHMRSHTTNNRHLKPSTAQLLTRKLGGTASKWSKSTIAITRKALATYLEELQATEYRGVVFDYDETLCPSSHRFGYLPANISVALTNIVEHGVVLGIASGRGRSVGHSMRESLDSSLWDRVVMGYYNGACVLRLNQGDPVRGQDMDPSLARFCASLWEHPLLPQMCEIESRPYQITLTPRKSIPGASVLELILELAAFNRMPGISVTRSSHSIDVLGPGVSKLSVVDACFNQITEKQGKAHILRIGDSGTWYGNDLHLLAAPLSLSVAACPMNPNWAWNLAAPGHRGPQATLDYIQAMQFSQGSFSLSIDRLVGKLL